MVDAAFFQENIEWPTSSLGDVTHITEKWKGLSSVGFNTIDVAVSVPGQKNEAYLCEGAKYVRVDGKNDKIMYGPANLADEWPGLMNADFDSVDAVITVSTAKVDGGT
ncbi:hypothetical protein BDV38DRAFT_285920 [Aspergillus pseudotamarii]|uniref:Uncharacterized protein n=1 Tax=Aspergillus pseudotamarii TaxID=132259 RepID=A0A5N6SIJ6_ASPPS|nr:uncharacterized protein BDV38DRAFT_285920 [Aspergillus pseudotamarii]KAE8134455.1 hypothetical protein BDV38DRAFT_285920 [Aspergillus pseudotamarii]